MKFALGFVSALALIALFAFAVAITGAYDVAAALPENAIEHDILHFIMRKSVMARAGEEKRGSWSEEQIRGGFKDFDAMCITCHPAPGKERSDISKGLRPEPPDLAKASKQWTNAQLFWIVKNGVNMTGMPAFGPTHADEQIWNLVGFIRKLQGMSAQDFHSMELELGASSARDGHSH